MDKNNNYGAMKFCDVLLIVFVILKLVGVINWSWWWVLAPFWIPLLLIPIIYIILYLIDRRNL